MKKFLIIAAMLLSFSFLFIACSNNNSKNTKTEQLIADETYTCRMHNEVMSDHPGKCPKCEMNLVKQKMTDEQKK
ncbi:MAG: heavy metal-binding domain-containing protein [Chitinophagaceae bacterium]